MPIDIAETRMESRFLALLVADAKRRAGIGARTRKTFVPVRKTTTGGVIGSAYTLR
jgi:hypothetical protein